MRSALDVERRKRGARTDAYVAATKRLEAELRARGIQFPKAGRTTPAWTQACEDELPPEEWRTELGQRIAPEVAAVEHMLRAGRFDEAIAALERVRATDANNLIDAIGIAENGATRARRAGARAQAIALLRLAHDGYVWYASGASSGGEGMARMLDVERIRDRIREWERE
jgi:hypothetical protein